MMNNNNLDNELKNFDFSRCHPIREKLLQQLLTMHRQDNAAKKNLWTSKKMGEDEMDWAAAAGNPAVQARLDEQRKGK